MKVLKWIESKLNLHQLSSNYLSRLTITVCLLLTSLLVTSSQTTNIKPNEFKNAKAGVFSGNVQIEDSSRNKKKSYVVSFKSQLNQYTNLRLDVTAPFIGHIASVTVNNQNLQYMIPRKRTFFSGDVNSPGVKKHLPFPVNPKVLSHVFWGTPIKDKNWKCSQPSASKLICMRPAEGMKIVWQIIPKYKMPLTATITHPKGFVKFHIKNFTPGLTSEQLNRFVMARPDW